jgi:hypothetical protein
LTGPEPPGNQRLPPKKGDRFEPRPDQPPN